VVAAWDRRERSTRERVERLTLARWLPAVVAAAPFYAARDGGTDERALTDRSGLRNLPPIRSRDLLAAPGGAASAVLAPTEAQVEAAADRGALRRISRAIGRDGPEGKRAAIVQEYRPLLLLRAGPDGELLVASSRSDLDRMHRAGARAAAVLGLRDDDVVVSVVPAGPTLDHHGVIHLAAGAGLTALHARGAGEGPDVVVDAVRRLPPSVLVVPLAEAAIVADELRTAGADLASVTTVVVVGPPPDAALREAITAAFHAAGTGAVRVLALWGPTGARSPWAECAPGTGLHTTADLELLEVLDPMTGQVTDGDGDLTVTTMGWNGTALVRFQTGTWTDPSRDGDPCPVCGRTVPRLLGELVPHAWELPVATGTSSVGHVDLRGIAAVVAREAGVTRWRAELHGPNGSVPRDRLLVEVAGKPRDDRRMTAAIGAAAGLTPELTTGSTDAQVQATISELGGQLVDRR
jgi:hypothetical protein